METFSFGLLFLGVFLVVSAVVGALVLFGLRTSLRLPTSSSILLSLPILVGRSRTLSFNNICLTFFFFFFRDGFEGLQLIEQLSHIIAQLVHNIVTPKLEESRGE